MNMRKSVYIVYTGGTIGMKKNAQGVYEPTSGYLEALMAENPTFQDPQLPHYQIHDYHPLLDSSNMKPENWMKIANDIKDNYQEYDGFIVLHGTDTMAYTASALPFMLQGLNKPVIVTGSQVPLCELRNDAQANLVTALMIAGGDYPINEVCLFFGSKLLRGCRSMKLHADSFDAFDSPNFPPLGTIGIDIKINTKLMRRQAPVDHNKLQVHPIKEPVVAALRLFPGISARVIENILQPPLKGLVLEAYGAGNGPDGDEAIMEAIRQATQRGVVIVDCTQCLTGTVNLTIYKAGSALAEAGVVSGFDMTSEAALVKLYYLFSRYEDPKQVRDKMQQNLFGEMTC